MKAAIDNLKQKPKEQKTAVAGGIATGVVVILLIGWAIFYLKHVLSEKASLDDLPDDPYGFAAIRESSQDAANAAEEFRGSRESGSSNNEQPFGESRDSNLTF